MNWEAIGSLAELLGALGVIASLLYLSAQVRHGTRATRIATSHSISTATREWNHPLLNDLELNWTFTLGTEDPSQLDEKERARFYQICFSFFRMFEDIYYQQEHGALDPEIWEGYKIHFGAYAKAPGLLGYWKVRRKIFHRSFRDWLDAYEPPELDRLEAMVKGVASRAADDSH